MSRSSNYTPEERRHYAGDTPVVIRQKKYNDKEHWEGKLYPDWLLKDEGDDFPESPEQAGWDKMHEDEDGN